MGDLLQERKNKLFGNHVLTVTPLTPEGEIDEESTRNLVDYVIDRGVHGILAMGSTGEVFALTEDEKKRFLEIVIDQAKGRVPVGVGVNNSSSDSSANLARYAESKGADYIFTCGPYYHPHREEGIYRHVKYIADAVKDLPIMVYDGGAGIEIPLPLLKRMADNIPNLFCAKLFITYPSKISKYGEATGGKLQAWAGHDQMNYFMLLYGAKGMTSAASNVLPKEQTEMFNYIQEGKLDDARKIYLEKLATFNSFAFPNVLTYIQAYKTALYWMGVIKSDTCKVVMEPIDDIQKRELKETMKRIGLL
ncbi:dihydrodipicolinate synthase family protein [Desulfitobacterium sp. AusDCA]|uniref:dihydrodipicolinate synthase family protein n=1 Tax=Desulfitobacterium sp. AusDCA TaxID=3240383 RepID=UPI003DA71487